MKITWHKIDSFIGNFSCAELTYHRPCPICGSIHSKAVYELTDFQFYSDSPKLPKRTSVRHNQCLDCFCVYMNPCYSSYGFSVLFAEAGQSYGATAERPDEQLAWLKSRGLLQQGSRVLDVGCYDGRFLAKLPSGMDKVGIDIDGPAIERGKNTYAKDNIEFIHGDFENFGYPYSGPDTITMFHVLEHLPRPVVVLEKLRSIAADATKLVVEVPIVENGKTNDINGFLSIQHMTHFSRGSLRNALQRGGWKILEWVEMPDYNGCRVLVSPSDEHVALRAEPKDVRFLHDYMAFWHQAVVSVEEKLVSVSDCRKFIIWGAGAHTEFLYQTTSFFHANADRTYSLVDSDPLKHGRSWRGIPISSPDSLKGMNWSDVRLLVSSYGGQEGIARAAMEFGVPEDKIVRLYDRVRVY